MSFSRRHYPKVKPLLIGRLYADGHGISVWCPYCKDTHEHGWNPKERSDEVEHRHAHCTDRKSPFNDGGYWIGIDPREAKKGGGK
ncbi:MAG: hypothetical protein JXK94_06095 [Deltaproteobacteria bacterium]|nr:hypothetical protein [Deltaproteobacteria bacterium]